VLTNKYAEGYPGKRYYGGCEFVDVAESLAIERAKQLFGAEYANVQPHSGSQANQAVYMAMLQAGRHDPRHVARAWRAPHPRRVGEPVGQALSLVAYGLNAAEEIDYDQVRALAEEFNPRMIVAGASAYALRIDWEKFRDIADESGRVSLRGHGALRGTRRRELYPNPVGIADFVTTTTHKTLRGPRGGSSFARRSTRRRSTRRSSRRSRAGRSCT
jgi:glycine hydroxymethyltransferase